MRTVAVLLLLARVVGADVVANRTGADPLAYTLEYIGTDYDGAVRDGTVVDAAEYGELVRLAKRAIDDYGARKTDTVATGLRELEKMIEQKAPGPDVWAATRRLVQSLGKARGTGPRPAAPPNIADGRRLWASDCAPCHGPTGAGDGPAADGMTPAPTVFRLNRLDWLSPRQVYDAVVLGIPGTAMPSFAAAYDERQRWDVAFFVMTFRIGFDPTRPPADVKPGLERIAAASNAELLDDMRRAHPEATPGWVDYFRVNVSSGDGVLPLTGVVPPASSSMAAAVQMQNAFAEVADRLFPHVVGITSYVPEAPGEKGPAGGWVVADAQLQKFPGYRPFRSGSGFLMDDRGYILTSGWIIKQEGREVAPFVDVELSDQSHVVGRAIGAEPTLDLGVVRVADPAKLAKLDPPELGDSDRLQVGHWLIALGDPPGPDRTFSVGVVSSQPQRQCYQSELTATLVQSSLTIAPGGIGGPIADIFGHVVGLSVNPNPTDAAPPTTASAARILPSNLVLNLYEALKVAESQRSPWIGVSVLELDTARKRLGPTADVPSNGVQIDDVFEPSPASRAGIKPGDFLVAMNGHKLGTVADFQTWMYVLGIDARVRLDLVRAGQPMAVDVTIEARPAAATTR